jgi:hypothetical protein
MRTERAHDPRVEALALWNNPTSIHRADHLCDLLDGVLESIGRPRPLSIAFNLQVVERAAVECRHLRSCARRVHAADRPAARAERSARGDRPVVADRAGGKVDEQLRRSGTDRLSVLCSDIGLPRWQVPMPWPLVPEVNVDARRPSLVDLARRFSHLCVRHWNVKLRGVSKHAVQRGGDDDFVLANGGPRVVWS